MTHDHITIVCKDCGSAIATVDDPPTSADWLRVALLQSEHIATAHGDFRGVDAVEVIVTDWLARMTASRPI